MGWPQLAVVLASIVALLSGVPSAASDFHNGGVGDCDGCHDLHTSGGRLGGLLRGSDASSTCLRCHAARGGLHNVLSGDGSSFTAGGDFYWLTRSYAWIQDGRARTSPADKHGHNVVAVDYGMGSDIDLAVAPGGNYPSSDLSCVSCHDPHGRRTGDGNGGFPVDRSGSYQGDFPDGTFAGNFRLLGGLAYRTSTTIFANDAPVATAPTYWAETDDNHTDYGSGMSEWCTNCHSSMVGRGSSQHPSGRDAIFTERTASSYASYIQSGSFSGAADTSFLALVPFERGVSDASLLDPASTTGPEAGVSNVMCLTCHRAHASAFQVAGRWDLSATLLADSHPAFGDNGAGASDARNSYYGRDLTADFGPYQRSLCNKCHVGD